MHSVQPCAEKKALWGAYRAALRDYVQAITAMDAAEDGPSFGEARDHAMESRTAFDDRCHAYHAHLAAHGCDDVDRLSRAKL